MSDEYTMYLIVNCGLTQIPHNSLTVVGFYPSNSNKNMFTNYKLL